MERKGKDKEVHDSMTRIRANNFKKKGYNVQADIDEYETPDEINGHIPDIIAKKEKEKIIAETETCDSYNSEHTKSQYKAFDNETDAKFHVVIPKSCYKKARKKAEEWGITVDYWWYNSSY